ncbi:hypothetical protein [Methylibium petroleiphilum]|uniref:hypothetical protein n=1 Tax=Methylibium petroleiphilum TaxID=105560 RepID=UPI0005A52F45|nr:hypothetical protein [Methylibium petroleiphilum]
MNTNITAVQARLDDLSLLGRMALSLSCFGCDSSEMLHIARVMTDPRASLAQQLSAAQSHLGQLYLFFLEQAETLEATSRQRGLFTGDLVYTPFGDSRLANAMRAAQILTWEDLADRDLDALGAGAPGFGPHDLDRIRGGVQALARVGQVEGIAMSGTGKRLLARVNHSSLEALRLRIAPLFPGLAPPASPLSP